MPSYLFEEISIFALGVGFMTIAAWKTVEANPNRQIPLCKRVEHTPSPIMFFQMVGYSLTIWTVINLQDNWGLYSYLLFLVMILPAVILFTTHNRLLKERNASTS